MSLIGLSLNPEPTNLTNELTWLWPKPRIFGSGLTQVVIATSTLHPIQPPSLQRKKFKCNKRTRGH